MKFNEDRLKSAMKEALRFAERRGSASLVAIVGWLVGLVFCIVGKVAREGELGLCLFGLGVVVLVGWFWRRRERLVLL